MPLSYEDVVSLVKAGAGAKGTYLIDVRGVGEVQSSGIIPTAINIPLNVVTDGTFFKMSADDFQERYGLPKPDPATNRLVFYCMSGMRAQGAKAAAVAAGYTNVDVYPGSWSEWSSKTK